MTEMITDCRWCGHQNIPVKERGTDKGYEYYAVCPECHKTTIVERVDLTREHARDRRPDYDTERMRKEMRTYHIRGTKQNLDTLEQFLRHAEYLGSIGASRNLLLRIDGDGFGQLQIFDVNGEKINRDRYNTKQDLGEGALVGIYDIE